MTDSNEQQISEEQEKFIEESSATYNKVLELISQKNLNVQSAVISTLVSNLFAGLKELEENGTISSGTTSKVKEHIQNEMEL